MRTYDLCPSCYGVGVRNPTSPTEAKTCDQCDGTGLLPAGLKEKLVPPNEKPKVRSAI
jgi:DnaJ-class molecular chaperone